MLQGAVALQVYKNAADPNSGVAVNAAFAVVLPPFLTFGDTWYVRVRATGLTNYTISIRPVTVERPVWAMPTTFNQTFGDSGNDSAGNPLPGDRGIDLVQGAWHFYAVDVPNGNAGLLRTELQAISGNSDLYIREDGVPTTDHSSIGPLYSGYPALFDRSLTGNVTEYGNWVPLDGRTEKQLRPGRWYLGVKAAGNSNVRYRLIVSTGAVQGLSLNTLGAFGVNITNGGSGYSSAPTVSFSGGGGSGAAGTAVIQNGSVVGVNVTNGGSGYTTLPNVSISGGGGTGATATVTYSQILADNDWRYYRFTVPANAPNNWALTFSQQVGDVAMWLRDSVPPGQGYYNAPSGYYGYIQSSYSDNKNQGPYSGYGHDAAGTYTFMTPPLRPGRTYYAGFRSNNSATFSVSRATSGGSIGVLPVLAFYSGAINTTVPPNGSLLYRIPVPIEATRMKWVATHAATMDVRLEQGTLPGITGGQHWTSGGGTDVPFNMVLNSASWPWQPNQNYYLRIVNSTGSPQPVTLTINGKNAQTEDEDNDGLADAWELQHFGNLSYGPNDDPDGDGLANFAEYAFNLYPLLPGLPVLTPGTGTAGLPAIQLVGTGPNAHLAVEFVRRKAGTVLYTVEFTNSLDPGSWQPATAPPVVTSIDANWERVVIEDQVTVGGAAKRFGRVMAAKP